ncbi:MAG: LytTR family DNA-binding domain-containing protein [Sphingobacterium sp.]|jgi:DNA-binding LytR/AlgR family response regulator|nr:LytTR family DNA-binding domain-containing protein [Sphingobacterium sp.]
MKKVKCVIVDDELSMLKMLEKFVRQIPHLECLASFIDPIEAKEFILKSDADVVFLDIKMEKLSGLELVKLIPDYKVVFITGHEEFALQSWKLDNVVGYITKPFFFDDIVSIARRLSKIFLTESGEYIINSDVFLSYKHDDAIVRIEHETIIYIEAKRNYSTIYMDGAETNAPIPLWDIEKSLPRSKFVRVSKSIIVNSNKILDDSKEIILLGGFKLKPGKAYKGKISETN